MPAHACVARAAHLLAQQATWLRGQMRALQDGLAEKAGAVSTDALVSYMLMQTLSEIDERSA